MAEEWNADVLPVLRVDWIDADSPAGHWLTDDDFQEWVESDTCICSTVGFLVHEDDEVLILLQSGHRDGRAGAFRIPKVAIIRRVEMVAKDG